MLEIQEQAKYVQKQHRLAQIVKHAWAEKGFDVRVWVELEPRVYPAFTSMSGGKIVHHPSATMTVPEIRSDLVNGKPQRQLASWAA
jgi:hypothetical protein